MKTTTTKKAVINSTAIAIVAAPTATMDGLRQVLTSYHNASNSVEGAQKKLESAQVIRARCVRAFADTCKEMGWENLDAIKAKGQHRPELLRVAASCILNAAQLKAFNSDMAAYKTNDAGKRVYSAKHNAGTIVNNFLNRLIDAAEKVFDQDAPSVEEGAGKGANANKAKGLAEYMATTFADMVKRNGNDARKEAPTGSNHAKVKAELERAAKVVADLLK